MNNGCLKGKAMEEKIRRGLTIIDWLIAAGLGGLAAAIYFLQLSDFVYPGESASLLSAIQGLEEFPAARYPLASFFCGLFAPAQTIAPIAGALATSLLFLITTRYIKEELKSDLDSAEIDWMSRAAGMVAALVFLLSPTIKLAATHFEPRLVDLAWALSAAGMLMAMRKVHGFMAFIFPALAGAMMGVGVVDSPSFAFLAPLYLLGAWAIASKCRHVKGKSAAALFLFFFLGSLAIAVKSFYSGAENGAFSAWYSAMKASVKPWFGPEWSFTIPIFATLPFVTALFSARRAFRSTAGWMAVSFHAFMTVASVMAIVMSAGSIMDGTGYAPAFIAAFFAFTAGYLIVYWWHLAVVVGDSDEVETALPGDLPAYAAAPQKPPFRGVGLTALGLFALVLLGSIVANLFSEEEDASFADKVAGRIIADLGERDCLIIDPRITRGDGPHLATHIRLAAARAGKDLRLVRIDEKGGLDHVKEWFAKDPDVAKKAAVYAMPDLWRYAPGVEPVAEMFFFGGDKARTAPSIEERREFAELLYAPPGWGSYGDNIDRASLTRFDYFRLSLRSQLAFTSCMAGCAAHAEGDDEAAFGFYEFVLRELDGDNIVAVFNEMELAKKGFEGAAARKADNERFLAKVASDKRRRYNLSSLSLFYGYVMNRDQILRMGLGLLDGDESEIGLSHIERAISQMPENAGDWLRLNVLAPHWVTGDAKDRESARKEFAKVLERDPTNYSALMGQARLAMMDGDREGSIALLEKALAVGGDDPRVAVDLARLRLMKGEFEEAKPILLKASDLHPSDRGLWLMRAGAALAEYDALAKEGSSAIEKRQALLDELEVVIIPGLERLGKDHADTLFAKAEVLLRLGGAENLAKARDIYADITKRNPKNPAYREKHMETLAALGEGEEAVRVAKEVLADGSPSPLANLIVGTDALGEGRLDEAEEHLRRAGAFPLALNNLAECLRRKKSFAEAEEVAKKLTEMAGEVYLAWETLGSIILDAGDPSRYAEAEGHIQKAWNMTRQSGEDADVRVVVSLARAKSLMGNKAAAKNLLGVAAKHADRLEGESKELYERLRAE